jgi:hypothetical protein
MRLSQGRDTLRNAMAKQGVVALFLLIGLLVTGVPALWAKDVSWNSFQEGRRLYDEKRLGEALNAWKRAIDERRS